MNRLVLNINGGEEVLLELLIEVNRIACEQNGRILCKSEKIITGEDENEMTDNRVVRVIDIQKEADDQDLPVDVYDIRQRLKDDILAHALPAPKPATKPATAGKPDQLAELREKYPNYMNGHGIYELSQIHGGINVVLQSTQNYTNYDEDMEFIRAVFSALSLVCGESK